jgi:hypothetical protein
MSGRDPRAFWRPSKLAEFNLILWSAWDPIGAGVPLDEYESYAPRVASLLESGADAGALAEALAELRVHRMGLDPALEEDRRAASKLIDWYSQVRTTESV